MEGGVNIEHTNSIGMVLQNQEPAGSKVTLKVKEVRIPKLPSPHMHLSCVCVCVVLLTVAQPE